ncbi:hypothetical protein O181_062946 [Austropuccinia psidii MF-1]|uniref:Uncharacterized protein n=1 Tax=Austropuccinia psidii MF-1 TaxID=1389203 RepID=A0A9Q3EJ17_9BASI|nr:hypothetical protein [Austropuccinia psidii MF-1]
MEGKESQKGLASFMEKKFEFSINQVANPKVTPLLNDLLRSSIVKVFGFFPNIFIQGFLLFPLLVPGLHPFLLPPRPSPIPSARPSPIPPFRNLQSVASTYNHGIAERFPLPYKATQALQRRENWPIRATRKDPNVANEAQDSVAIIFTRVDRNGREVIIYSKNKMILGPSSEERAYKSSWYENELIN